MAGQKREDVKRLVVVVAVAALIAACTMPKRDLPPLPLGGPRWEAVLDPVPGQRERAYLQFANGYVSGSGGCNRISGTYHLDSVGAGAIVFSRLAGTKVMCPPEIQAGENQMLLVMQGTSSFSIKGALGNELTLSGSAGTMLFIADRPELKQDPAAK
jgi:heat shock protein HslJ